jgi:hypothetical protein
MAGIITFAATGTNKYIQVTDRLSKPIKQQRSPLLEVGEAGWPVEVSTQSGEEVGEDYGIIDIEVGRVADSYNSCEKYKRLRIKSGTTQDVDDSCLPAA